MHQGKKIKRTEKEQQAKKEKEAILIKNYNFQVDKCRKLRKEGKKDQEALKATRDVLLKNPESYTIWNYRREILKEMLNDGLLTDELVFTMERMKEYPKVYWIWNHRRWCLESMNEPNWKQELKLVSKMLEADPRNFHGWHYRRYVVAAIENQTDEKMIDSELDYTKSKINNNFSNFSAWHNRSKLLPLFTARLDNNDDKKKVWLDELEYVRQAWWMDADDQSAWLYHHWLVGHYKDLAPNVSEDEYLKVLKNEIASISELYELEGENKWCMLSLVHYNKLLSKFEPIDNENVNNLLKTLIKVDPMRANRYENQIM